MENAGDSQQWDLEIKPSTRIFDLHLTDVWNYRDLLWLLVRRDFVSVYKQTIFGPIWFFIQPIFTTIIYTLVFGRMAGLSPKGIPAPLFFLSGIIAWNYFAECLTKTSTVFRDNAGVFGKVYFPRLIMPLSIVLSNLVKFGVQLILFLLMLCWYLLKQNSIQPNAFLLLLPVVILLMALQGFGLGLIVTALTTKYRDLAFLVAFGVQLAMYATPVIYPLSKVPFAFQSTIVYNPMSGLIETFRYAFLGSGHFYSGAFTYSVIASVFVFFSGVFVFNRVEKNFVDTV